MPVSLGRAFTGALAVVVLTLLSAPSAFPEPGTMALLGTGVLALAKLAHRRRQDSSAEK